MHHQQDHPVPIGYGETISAPHMHAEALRLLEDHCTLGASVLDVGSGNLLDLKVELCSSCNCQCSVFPDLINVCTHNPCEYLN